MRPNHYRVSLSAVANLVIEHLQNVLALADFGSRVTGLLLTQLLVAASVRRSSLSAACQERRRVPCDETVRRAVWANLPEDIADLQRRLAAGLTSPVPRGIRRRPRPLAIDLTLLPFYGDHKTPRLFRGQAKQGTKYFWAYATCVIVSRGQRLTVGLVPVANPGSLEKVIEQLLAQAAAFGVRPSYLLLDRGFYAAKIIAWLQQHDIPFVMPMIRRGRKPDHPRGPSGTQVFFQPGQGGFHKHSWTGKRDRSKVTVDVAVVPHRRTAPQVYAFHGKRRSLPWYVDAYRKRFGIESSYRQLHECLARTTVCDARWRLLLAGIAVILRNAWVELHWNTLSTVRRGGRQLRLCLMRFEKLLNWLLVAIDQALRIQDELVAQRPLQQPP
jgi:Transposase DDE domain